MGKKGCIKGKASRSRDNSDVAGSPVPSPSSDEDDAEDMMRFPLDKNPEPDFGLFCYILVKDEFKELHCFEGRLDDTVATIKVKIEFEDGIPTDQQRLIFGGKQLADDRTFASLADAAITPDGYKVVHLTLMSDGGGQKRARGSKDMDDDNEPSTAASSIPDLGNMSMVSKPDDAPAVQDVIGLGGIDVPSWVGSLGIEDLETLKAHIDKYKRAPFIDTALRAYASQLQVMKTIEDQKQRLGDSKQLLLSKFKDQFNDYTKKDIGAFSFQITTALAAKHKKAEDDRVAEAVAKATAEAVVKAQAEAEGGLMRRFFG